MDATEKAILKRVRKYIVASILKFSGPQGFITGIILDYVLKKAWIVAEDLLVIWKIKIETHQKREKYEKIINDPNSTAEDIANGFHDILNG